MSTPGIKHTVAEVQLVIADPLGVARRRSASADTDAAALERSLLGSARGAERRRFYRLRNGMPVALTSRDAAMGIPR